MAKTKSKLNKREVDLIQRIYDRVCFLEKRFDEYEGTDIRLQISCNGTVGGCLNAALAALETILQEY